MKNWLYDFLNSLHKAVRGSQLDKASFYFYEQTLSQFERPVIEKAILAHVKASRFFPAPAEILERISKPVDEKNTPGPSPSEQERILEWRKALTAEYKKLPDEQKSKIKKIFLNRAHKFVKGRLKNAVPEQLGDLMVFQLFLEANAGGIRETEKGD
jgi:hypothetical protein